MIKTYGIHNEPKLEFTHASTAVSGSVRQKQMLLLPPGAGVGRHGVEMWRQRVVTVTNKWQVTNGAHL